MRLLSLYIGEYRVLQQLGIRFDPAEPKANVGRSFHLDFLVGVNGTGKSTVLRLLARIFSGVERSFDDLRDLPFVVEYLLDEQRKKVRISNIDLSEKTMLDGRFFVTTAEGLEGEYATDEAADPYLCYLVDGELLPRRVIAYTTGREEEWTAALRRATPAEGDSAAIHGLSSEERSLQELPGWLHRSFEGSEQQQAASKRVRFVTQAQLPLVALAGLLRHRTYAAEQAPLKQALEETAIENLAGFSLRFDMPYATDGERRDVWSRFGQHATRAIQSGGRFLLTFELTDDKAKGLLEANDGTLPFFERLADWSGQDNPILTKTTLFLERKPVAPDQKDEPEDEQEAKQPVMPPLHTWDWLSDGERSFLGRMCLFLLFGEVESLILLDEPEVHFNDYWKRHIVSTMDQVFKLKSARVVSHVVIATHSSISLSDVDSSDVLILERQSFNTSMTKSPSMQTFGADPSEIMVHVFGAPHAAGQYSVSEIENWLGNAYGINDEAARRVYLGQRLQQVAPGYWAYRIRREMVGLPQQ